MSDGASGRAGSINTTRLPTNTRVSHRALLRFKRRSAIDVSATTIRASKCSQNGVNFSSPSRSALARVRWPARARALARLSVNASFNVACVRVCRCRGNSRTACVRALQRRTICSSSSSTSSRTQSNATERALLLVRKHRRTHTTARAATNTFHSRTSANFLFAARARAAPHRTDKLRALSSKHAHMNARTHAHTHSRTSLVFATSTLCLLACLLARANDRPAVVRNNTRTRARSRTRTHQVVAANLSDERASARTRKPTRANTDTQSVRARALARSLARTQQPHKTAAAKATAVADIAAAATAAAILVAVRPERERARAFYIVEFVVGSLCSSPSLLLPYLIS